MERALPEEVVEIARDIKDMRIRGAGRIARAAARALSMAVEKYSGDDLEDFRRYIGFVAEYLVKTRPTAVSLPNAVSFVVNPFFKARDLKSVQEARRMLLERASAFIKYSEDALERIAEIGSRLVQDGDNILTHCNSEAVASIIRRAIREGKNIKVFATETRPLYQGHITARMLLDAGADITLIPDSSIRSIIRRIDKVIVGADTVTANGAVVNKIGTSLIALIAHERRTDFYVATETYKFSPYTVWGEPVVIEERAPTEVASQEFLDKHPKLKILNPSFDVTPSSYITGIITEIGLIPPNAALLVLEEVYGREAGHEPIQGLDEGEV
ncbi:MAG: ribose 1,5-bisphosphate isomerase [Infirmifilum sp.]|nr:ribose 1,5-bisphosphate isomerase [Infirmifilum uzonense]